MKKVKIYSTPTCPYCNMAKDFLKEKGVDYEDVDLSSNELAREEIIKKTGQMSVPVIELSEEGKEPEYIIGFDQKKLEQALGL
jgi:glutaredoxin-like YruB-family protein